MSAVLTTRCLYHLCVLYKVQFVHFIMQVCMNGRNMFMGYLNAEEKTRETLDDDGWVHSGDVGRRDKRGFLHITGRIKGIV